jgi:hypothetical protein
VKKQLNISWGPVKDSTGYLFSFAKSLCAAVKNSPYSEKAEDIVATSGFAFRMWVNADLCPSATSIWDFEMQKPWVESGGILCDYTGRYWGQDFIEEERRLQALEIIKSSIDRGIPAVSWNVGVPEWGLITGYDDEAKILATLPVTSSQYGQMAYEALGKGELPILSVLTVKGASDKSEEAILKDTLKIAVCHLTGKEWCENAKGLYAYPVLIKIFSEKPDHAASWNGEYYLGTYAALKEYTYRYFEKTGLAKLADIYKAVFYAWTEAFRLKTGENAALPEIREKIASLLSSAYENEQKAVEIMESLLA